VLSSEGITSVSHTLGIRYRWQFCVFPTIAEPHLYLRGRQSRVECGGRDKNPSYPVSGNRSLVLQSSRPVFLNRRAAVRYRAPASIIPGRERFSWNLSF